MKPAKSLLHFQFRCRYRAFYTFPNRFNAHSVERAVDEEHGNEEEHQGEHHAEPMPLLRRQRHGKFDGQQSEQRRELDDRVQGDRRGVLERIADRVADHRGLMQCGALGLQLDLHDLLRVVPGAAGIGHEDGLVQAEEGDRDQIADKEVGFDERERER